MMVRVLGQDSKLPRFRRLELDGILVIGVCGVEGSSPLP